MKEVKFVIKIYHNDIFIGYLKKYRKCRNDKYRFERSVNVNDSLQFSYKGHTDLIKYKLTNLKDPIYYNDSYTFKESELTDQEMRKSKLEFLNVVKIRYGIFKREK